MQPRTISNTPNNNNNSIIPQIQSAPNKPTSSNENVNGNTTVGHLTPFQINRNASMPDQLKLDAPNQTNVIIDGSMLKPRKVMSHLKNDDGSIILQLKANPLTTNIIPPFVKPTTENSDDSNTLLIRLKVPSTEGVTITPKPTSPKITTPKIPIPLKSIPNSYSIDSMKEFLISQPIVTIKKKKESDDDIELSDEKISFNCPLSFTRILHPTKGKQCIHPQCFDALTFFQLASKKSFKCVICDRVIIPTVNLKV